MTSKKLSYSSTLSEYLFLMWDGLGFFGFSDIKLERLKGIKPHWYDRFKIKRWVLMNIIILLLYIYILIGVFNTLGDVKT